MSTICRLNDWSLEQNAFGVRIQAVMLLLCWTIGTYMFVYSCVIMKDKSFIQF